MDHDAGDAADDSGFLCDPHDAFLHEAASSLSSSRTSSPQSSTFDDDDGYDPCFAYDGHADYLNSLDLDFAHYDRDTDFLACCEDLTGFLAARDLRAAAASSRSARPWGAFARRRYDAWRRCDTPEDYRQDLFETFTSAFP